MSDSLQTAVRVGDDILHTKAHDWGVAGIIGGLAAGLFVGFFLVAGTIATGGALAVVVGATLLGGGIVGGLGKMLGSHQPASVKGKVLTGSPNVFIGYDKRPAARAEADVAHCEEHSDSESALEQPAILGKKIAQGSEHVLINGHYAARKGDRGTCDFTLGDGWPTVVIGGPPKTVAGLTITSETASIDGLILGMTLVGGVLLMVPAAGAIIAEGAAASLGWGSIAGQLALRLGGQFALGMGLSTAGGMGFGYVGGKIWGEGSLGQDLSAFVGQVFVPFAGAAKIPGVGKSAYGLIDGVPLFGNRAGGAIPEGLPAGADAPQRLGGTGAKPEIMSDAARQAQANAAYDKIRANPDDVAQIAKNTGHSPETIQTVKDHLFNSQHDITNPETGQVTRGNFTADETTVEQWNKAADGTLGQPKLTPWGTPEGPAKSGEVTAFNRLIAHEYVEQGLISDGLIYQHPESWVPSEENIGQWDYKPKPGKFGAHDLSPNFREDPFSHYKTTLNRSSEGIPRPNENYSNLDEVLAGVRRSLAEQGGPPEGGTSGPKGGGGPKGGDGPAGGEKPFTPAEPLPPNLPEGRPVAPAPEAEPVAFSEATPGEQPGLEAAPERIGPLPAADPQGPTPEPAPEGSAPDDAPGSGPADAEPPVTKLSQPGGLKATEGTRVTKPNGSLGPASHPLESHGPDRPLSVSDGLDSVEQRMIDKPNMSSSTKFTDRAAMETAIGKAVDAKTADIDAWLATNPPAGSNMPPIDYNPQMGNVGAGYSRPSAGAPYGPINTPLESIRMILKSDGNGGYVIQTAYPTP